jgi:hypothetical protein
MPLPEVQILKQRINHLIQHDQYSIAAKALESFMNRLRGLNHRIHQLPFDDRNAMQAVLYTELEKVLMRFQELEWLGPQSGPVAINRHRASEAIHAYGVRFDKIEKRLEQVSTERRLATFAVLHRESEVALRPFEHHRWVRKKRVSRQFIPKPRLRWN